MHGGGRSPYRQHTAYESTASQASIPPPPPPPPQMWVDHTSCCFLNVNYVILRIPHWGLFEGKPEGHLLDLLFGSPKTSLDKTLTQVYCRPDLSRLRARTPRPNHLQLFWNWGKFKILPHCSLEILVSSGSCASKGIRQLTCFGFLLQRSGFLLLVFKKGTSVRDSADILAFQKKGLTPTLPWARPAMQAAERLMSWVCQALKACESSRLARCIPAPSYIVANRPFFIS